MVFLSKTSGIDLDAVVLCSVVAFLYTVSSTLGLKAHAHKPFFVVRLFFTLMFLYIVVFVFVLPSTVYIYLLLAASFYLAYIVFVFLCRFFEARCS